MGLPSSVSADAGRWSFTVKPSRPGNRLGVFRNGQFLGVVGLGAVAVYWLRRPVGSRSWSLPRLR